MLTDLEFYEIRYSGKAAATVRAFRAVYLGLFFNIVIMSTVNLAAAKIANVLLGWPMWQTLGVCAIINVAFASIAGLWGVLITDVDGGSDAAEKRLSAGDVIVEVARDAVSSAAEVKKRVDQLKKEGKKSVLLLIANGEGELRFVAVSLQ